MLTLGIDPGTATLGWGLVEENGQGLREIAYGAIKTTPKQEISERLRILHEGLTKLIEKYKPECVAIEKLFFGANAKTAISVGQAMGVVILAAAENRVPIAEYTPLQVKIAATGWGRADKRQMQQMVKTLLGLSEIPKPDDAADALAVAICHLHSRRLSA